MFKSPIIPKAIIAAFYGTGKNNSYGREMEKMFDDKGGFPLVTIALIGAAVLSCIHEWKTGEQRTIPFTEPVYSPAFERILTSLRGWKQYTTVKGSSLTEKLQKALLKNARESVGLTEKVSSIPAAATNAFDRDDFANNEDDSSDLGSDE
ncbi:hypothetical protein QCA50_011644 [Cerrena zonata]|uniref:DUF6532 domain-containing protein n=1 Tax=Cerrena zonata TaxID=2478898 RepID=A0AAW0FWJ5_9APHY